MRNYEQYKRLIRFLFSTVLLFIQVGIFLYVWLNFYGNLMEIPYQKKGNWLMAAMYGAALICFAKMYGGWKIGFQRIFNIIYSQCLASVLTNLVTYLLVTLLTKHFQTIKPLLLMTLLQFGIAALWGTVSTRTYLIVYPPRKVLLVFGERPIHSLVGKLYSRADRFEIGRSVNIAEGLEKIKRLAGEFEGVVIADIPSYDRNQILKFCYGSSIRVYVLPKISDIIIKSAECQHMFDTPMFLFRNTGLSVEQRVIKRVTDVILSFITLILLSPVLILTAGLIKLQDGGRIIYKQIRLTEDGKEFSVLKFRSMREDAEKDGVARLASEHDDRITPVGRVIRAVRIDELPQLFNILKGDMSIVGPRPERPEIAREYIEEIPEFTYRLKIKAGLTGYAQVYGKYNTTAYDKLKLDLMYIQNYSIWLDFEIIFKTIQILFMRESTEGLEEGNRLAVAKNEKK